MVSIAVGCDQHLMSRPSLGSELQCNLMGLLRCDNFLGREGLHILVEFCTLHLTIGFFGSHEFCEGILTVAVNAADQTATAARIIDLLILTAVADDTSHSTDRLLLFLDVGNCRHQSLLAMREISS